MLRTNLAVASVITLAIAVAPMALAAGPGEGLNVNVTNIPLPVTVGGGVNVSGSVTVGNTAQNPVPVTGTVKIQGDVTAGVESLDQTAAVFAGAFQVSSSTFGNARTPILDVKGYKELRVSIQTGSGTLTGPIRVAVTFATGDFFNQADRFNLSQPADIGVGFFETRTYTVPGDKMLIDLAASAAGTNDSVRVIVFGRAN